MLLCHPQCAKIMLLGKTRETTGHLFLSTNSYLLFTTFEKVFRSFNDVKVLIPHCETTLHVQILYSKPY